MAKQRLIDADALDKKLESLKKRYAAQGRTQVADDYNFVQTILLATPTIDAVPVVHGRWVHNDEYVLWAERYICSVCNCNAPSDGDYRHNLSNYCPDCGAKMDLEVGSDG